MKRILLILTTALLITGCASTSRLDGGASSIHGVDPTTGLANGKKIEIFKVDLFGAIFRLIPFKFETGLASTIDEPTIAIGATAASATAIANMSAESVRSNGVKRVTYGASGFDTKAQELDSIIARLNELKVSVPGEGLISPDITPDN